MMMFKFFNVHWYSFNKYIYVFIHLWKLVGWLGYDWVFPHMDVSHQMTFENLLL